MSGDEIFGVICFILVCAGVFVGIVLPIARDMGSRVPADVCPVCFAEPGESCIDEQCRDVPPHRQRPRQRQGPS